MVISDEMDAAFLHQWGSDENSWQTEEQAKKEYVQMTKSWSQEGTGSLPELLLKWSDYETL